MRAFAIVVWLRVVGLALLCGCFERGDGTAAGSGGSGDTSGTSGVGAPFPVGGSEGGAFAAGGVGGFGGVEAPVESCPSVDVHCDEASREAACLELIECARVPGPLPLDRCMAEIDVGCVSCVEELSASDGSDAGVSDEDAGAAEPSSCENGYEAAAGCDDLCDLLAEPPQTLTECRLLVREELGKDAFDAECFCDSCSQFVSNCLFDDGCWLLAQCALVTGCHGMECFDRETCTLAVDRTPEERLGSRETFLAFDSCGPVLCDP